jgi:hypothetical protein
MKKKKTEHKCEITCWCGHTKEQHGPDNVYSRDGRYRVDGCTACPQIAGKCCDEFQIFLGISEAVNC